MCLYLILSTFLSQEVERPGPYVLCRSGGGREPSAGAAGSEGGVGGEGEKLVWCPFLPAPLYISELAVSVSPLRIAAGSAAQGEQPSPPQPSAHGLRRHPTSLHEMMSHAGVFSRIECIAAGFCTNLAL